MKEAAGDLFAPHRDLTATMASALAATVTRGYGSTLKEAGYRAHLIFLWLPSADMAIARVQARVLAGSHAIAEAVVRRRYDLGLKNLFGLYQPIVDTWRVLDNSVSEATVSVRFGSAL